MWWLWCASNRAPNEEAKINGGDAKRTPTTLTTMATIYENLIDQDMYSSDCSSTRASTPSIVEQPLPTC
ncbi:hypothetical protein NPIL_592081 [Nephila pilipes]|uniref:Uncharacterized protein n=1 Tax=Nephila pilipes TaxID=299642 RepID=A0A8X6PQG1_NEPPI|nr:hypothetical protein NPIL_592081 [Nephila pilipes]